MLGHRFLLLVHSGRRTGRRYQTVVEVIRWDPAAREAVVLSGRGPRASWFRNVEAGGLVEIRIGRLAGSRYDGSAEARLAVVRALPVVAFTPRLP